MVKSRMPISGSEEEEEAAAATRLQARQRGRSNRKQHRRRQRPLNAQAGPHQITSKAHDDPEVDPAKPDPPIADASPPASSTESEQTALKSLVSALGNEEGRAELKALFATLDKDGDGKVTSKEWGSSLSKNKELMGKYFGGSSMQEIGKAFKRLDLHGDGELDWEEFLHGAEVQAASLGVDFAPIRGADAALQRRPAADESEQTALKSLVSALGSEEGRAELKALFAMLDKDGDGKVTSKEWGSSLSKNKELMGKYFGGSSMQEIGKAFKRLDLNGDGELDWEEFLHGAEVQAASLGVDFAPIRGADAALHSRPAADNPKPMKHRRSRTLDKDGKVRPRRDRRCSSSSSEQPAASTNEQVTQCPLSDTPSLCLTPRSTCLRRSEALHLTQSWPRFQHHRRRRWRSLLRCGRGRQEQRRRRRRWRRRWWRRNQQKRWPRWRRRRWRSRRRRAAIR